MQSCKTSAKGGNHAGVHTSLIILEIRLAPDKPANEATKAKVEGEKRASSGR